LINSEDDGGSHKEQSMLAKEEDAEDDSGGMHDHLICSLHESAIDILLERSDTKKLKEHRDIINNKFVMTDYF